jgi:ribonuclease R
VQPKTDRRASYGRGRRAPEIEIPQEIHITPRMYQKLTQKIAGKPEERILSYLMLRSLKQARYSEENLGHFALAASTYTHFTSPIRRYPDLIVHRILKQVLQTSAERFEEQVPVGNSVSEAEAQQSTDASVSAPNLAHGLSARKASTANPVPQGREKYGSEILPAKARFDSLSSMSRSEAAPRPIGSPSPWSKPGGREPLKVEDGPISIDELHAIAEESSQSERRADDAERELMEWKKAKFMRDRIGEDFEGLIISVTKYGFFVELTDLFVEGLVPLSTLTDDRYTYHENTREIIGHRSRRIFRLGQQVRVLVDRIDPVEKKIQFALLEEKRKGKRK